MAIIIIFNHYNTKKSITTVTNQILHIHAKSYFFPVYLDAFRCSNGKTLQIYILNRTENQWKFLTENYTSMHKGDTLLHYVECRLCACSYVSGD
jgi:hypothetical protein